MSDVTPMERVSEEKIEQTQQSLLGDLQNASTSLDYAVHQNDGTLSGLDDKETSYVVHQLVKIQLYAQELIRWILL
jgi:hypothetical protein